MNIKNLMTSIAKSLANAEKNTKAIAPIRNELPEKHANVDTAYAIQEIIKNYQVVSQSLTAPKSSSASMQLIKGSECQTCGAFAVIKVDGCSKCTACGEIGSCG